MATSRRLTFHVAPVGKRVVKDSARTLPVGSIMNTAATRLGVARAGLKHAEGFWKLPWSGR